MNRYELRRLKRDLRKMMECNKPFAIKLTDKAYLYQNDQLTEIDIIPTDLKVFEIDVEDEKFVFIGQTNNEPDYIKVITVSEAKKQGLL